MANDPKSEAQLHDIIGRMRHRARDRLRSCGYSDPDVERMFAGIGPFPESKVDGVPRRDPAAKSEREAFSLLHVLWYLRDFDTKWMAGDYATAVLCFHAATEAHPGLMLLEKTIAGYESGQLRQEERTKTLQLAADTYRAMSRVGDAPTKVDALWATAWPTATDDRPALGTFRNYITAIGGMDKLDGSFPER